MKFLRALICAGLFALQLSPAFAFWHGSLVFAANPALSGFVGFDRTMIPFVNLMKMADSANSATVNYPGLLQTTTNLPTGALSTNLSYIPNIPSNYTGQFVLSMPGASISGGGFKWNNNNFRLWGTVYSVGAGTTLSGCTNSNVPPCQWTTTLTVSGTSPQVTMDFSLPITGVSNSVTTPGLIHVAWSSTNITQVSVVTIIGVVGSDGNGCGANGQWTLINQTSAGADLVGTSFPGGCTYTSGGQVFPYNTATAKSAPFSWLSGTTISGLTSLVFCKLADYNADNTCNTQSGHTAWAGGFSDDFITKVATPRPIHIRMLDVNQTININVPQDFNGWQTASAWSYGATNDWWVMTNWFGSSSGTNSYLIDCTTSPTCTYTLTAGAPKNGDFFQFYNVNANTNAVPTIQVKDASSVTSSAIPILSQGATQIGPTIGGTLTTGDTISLTFTTTPLGAYTCLAGGTHTTSAYTVLVSDTLNSVATGLFNIVAADATLSAQPTSIFTRNPNGGSGGSFQIGYANNACALTITANITGSATETYTSAILGVGSLHANTLYSVVYNSTLQGFVVANGNPAGGGASAAWPWSVQVALAKDVSTKLGIQVGCWLQIPLLWSDASATSLFNFANANQCPGGTKFELSNEVWNTATFVPPQAIFLAASLGLNGDNYAYYELRQRQLWGIASSVFGSISGNLHTISAWQVGGNSSNELGGTTLCGTGGAGVCSNNQAYQRTVGVNYNSAPNRPGDFTRHLSQAPYYHGGLVSGSYSSSGNYGTWSATSSSVSSNVLTVNGTVTGTIWPNQGITSCDGTFIKTTSPSSAGSFPNAQLTGTVTTTLNGAVSDNTHTWTLTSTAGISAGMWIYNQTTGTINATVLAVLNGTQITAGVAGTGKTYRSAGTSDTIVFGGQTGTYRLNSTSCSIASGTITGGDVLGLQYMADNYCTASGACSTGNSGLGSLQDAYDWLAQDIIAAAKNSQDLASDASNIFAFQQIASVAVPFSIDSQSYEGGYDGFAPTTTQATSMGLPSSSYGMTGSSTTPTWDGYIGQAIFAFKNNTTYKTVATTVHNQELSFEPAGSTSQKYVFSSNARWAFFPGDLYSTPYQDYNAMCVQNGVSC